MDVLVWSEYHASVDRASDITSDIDKEMLRTSGVRKVCYVIFVGESDVAAHFINGRKGVWVRTDEFSSRFEARMANENELRLCLIAANKSVNGE